MFILNYNNIPNITEQSHNGLNRNNLLSIKLKKA